MAGRCFLGKAQASCSQTNALGGNGNAMRHVRKLECVLVVATSMQLCMSVIVCGLVEMQPVCSRAYWRR